MLQITIDDLDKFDVNTLKKQLCQTVDKFAGIDEYSSNSPNWDEYIYIDNVRCCCLSFMGLPDYYVSENGDVYSARKSPENLKKMKCYKSRGSMTVGLSNDAGETRIFVVHRLVARAFLGDRNEEIIFLDGDRYNCTLRNLVYLQGAKDSGMDLKSKRGTKHKVEIEEIDKDGNVLNTWASATEAHKECGISVSQIVQVAKGKWHTAKGRMFRYKVTD